MELDLSTLAVGDCYKLLCGLVTPRPIALVTTMNTDGTPNAAPFSFFNVISHDPPLVVLGFDAKADGEPKDTVRNIRERGEFVVNLVDEALAGQMNVCGGEFPYLFDELAAAGLNALASTKVKTCRIQKAPASLECTLVTDLSFGERRTVIIGQIVNVHAREGLVNQKFHVDQSERKSVGRMAGSTYSRSSDLFIIDANHNKEWQGGM